MMPYGLDALADAATIIVPSWRSAIKPPPAALAALRAAHADGATVVGLCRGAFVLAAAGLLDGRRAATHWLYAPALAAAHPEVKVDAAVLFVDDGDVITSAGPPPASMRACTWYGPASAPRSPTPSPGAWSCPRNAAAVRHSTSNARCPTPTRATRSARSSATRSAASPTRTSTSPHWPSRPS